MRKLASVALTAGLLVSLSACSGSPFLGASCTPQYTDGNNSALVTANGTFANDPKADFPTPLVSKSIQVKATEEGDGDLVGSGNVVDVQVTIYNAKTGTKLISTDYTGTGLRVLASAGLPSFGAVTECVSSGSRVVAVGAAGDLIGQESLDQNGLPLEVDDSIVMVVDVLDTFPGRATGADQLSQAGLPSVVLAPDGRPGLTIPSGAPPTDLRIATLKAGNGAKVAEGDAVVLAYTGVLWETKKVFDSTWDSGLPRTLVAEETSADVSGLVPGFAQALIGSRVGSQVIVVVPPEFGYPSGSGPATVPDGSTMVFVFDVLGIE